jgi:plastocyanin
MTNRSRARGSRAGNLLLPALALLGLVVAACGSGSARDASPVATTTVDLPASYRFAPAAIAVTTGATVTWTNHDNFTHNVSLPGAEPLTMAPGESASHTFTAAGRFDYVCSLHPKDMRGSVVVTN